MSYAARGVLARGAAETIDKGCDCLRESVQARDQPATVLALIEQVRLDAMRALGVGSNPTSPADVYRQPAGLWP